MQYGYQGGEGEEPEPAGAPRPKRVQSMEMETLAAERYGVGVGGGGGGGGGGLGGGGRAGGTGSNRELNYRDDWYMDDEDLDEARRRRVGSRCVDLAAVGGGGLGWKDLQTFLLMVLVGCVLFFGLQEMGKLTRVARDWKRGADHSDSAWRDAALGDTGDGRQSFGTISEYRVRDGFCSLSKAWSGYFQTAQGVGHSAPGKPGQDTTVAAAAAAAAGGGGSGGGGGGGGGGGDGRRLNGAQTHIPFTHLSHVRRRRFLGDEDGSTGRAHDRVTAAAAAATADAASGEGSGEDIGIDLGAGSGKATRNLFYWYIESERDPANDPLVLMLVGGPGCAATTALLTEGGPCHVTEALQAVRNQHAWTRYASIIWLDQPIGVGFSYGSSPDSGSERVLAGTTYAFLQAWFRQHEERRFNPFFLFGESHYVPAVAAAIRRGNAAKEQGLAAAGISIALRGVAIGNGMTDPATQMRSYANFASGANPYGIRAVNRTVEAAMRRATPECEARVARCQRAQAAERRQRLAAARGQLGAHGGRRRGAAAKAATAVCEESRSFCLDALVVPYLDTGRNIYDVRKHCDKPPFCYDFDHVRRFLQLSSTLDALSVRHSSKKWKICNFEVSHLFPCTAGDRCPRAARCETDRPPRAAAATLPPRPRALGAIALRRRLDALVPAGARDAAGAGRACAHLRRRRRLPVQLAGHLQDDDAAQVEGAAAVHVRAEAAVEERGEGRQQRAGITSVSSRPHLFARLQGRAHGAARPARGGRAAVRRLLARQGLMMF